MPHRHPLLLLAPPPHSARSFEFYEGIVRAAFGKFIVPGIMDDASDAVARFIEDEIIARVGWVSGGMGPQE
eukprot:365758-Chlamydomonas_euryale.AAC.7